MDVPALLDLAGLNIENIMESDWRFFYKHMMGTSVVRQSKNMLLISLPTNGGFVIKKNQAMIVSKYLQERVQ
jgi:hypothetical protein